MKQEESICPEMKPIIEKLLRLGWERVDEQKRDYSDEPHLAAYEKVVEEYSDYVECQSPVYRIYVAENKSHLKYSNGAYGLDYMVINTPNRNFFGRHILWSMSNSIEQLMQELYDEGLPFTKGTNVDIAWWRDQENLERKEALGLLAAEERDKT